MVAIADAMVRFAQPLIDASDGSPEQVQKAFMLSQREIHASRHANRHQLVFSVSDLACA